MPPPYSLYSIISRLAPFIKRGRDVTAENGKKRMGRPTENPRTEKIGFRMSPQEIEDIQLCADAMKTQRVNAVVEGIKLLKEKLNISKK